MFRNRRRMPSEERRRRRPRESRGRRSIWLYIFAGIGVAAVLFLLIRYAIIPLLVVLK